MKQQITLYKCDICKQEYIPDYTKEFITPFKITYEEEYNGMINLYSRDLNDICLKCSKELINTFVTIKK